MIVKSAGLSIVKSGYGWSRVRIDISLDSKILAILIVLMVIIRRNSRIVGSSWRSILVGVGLPVSTVVKNTVTNTCTLKGVLIRFTVCPIG